MAVRCARVLVVLTLVVSTALGCTGKGPGTTTGSGGSRPDGTGGTGTGTGGTGTGGTGTGGTGTGGTGTGGTGTGGTGSGGAPGQDAASDEGGGGADGQVVDGCPVAPVPLRRTGTVLELPIALTYGGQPFVYGEPNSLSSDATVTPLNIRFFLSAVELVATTGDSVPVDIVTQAGEVAPYGLFLYNAEDAGAQTLRVLAPAGTYAGVRFAVGLSVACNTGGPGGRAFPLTDASQMTWPLLAGYLFLRYEARVDAPAPPADGGAVLRPLPVAIHMGADLADLSVPSALALRVNGQLTVPATGPVVRGLQLAMDQVFKAANAPVDVSALPLAALLGPEGINGEALRRTGGDLPLFVLAP